MQNPEKIFNEIDARTINLDKDNIKRRYPKPFNRNAIKHIAYEYKKTKKGVKTISFLSQTKSEVTVQLNTGKEIANQNKDDNPKKPIDNPNNIKIEDVPNHPTVYGKVTITPNKLENGEYTYEDIMYLIKQCYELLK